MDKNIALDFVLRKKIVRKYLDNMKVDSNHRFKSWEHCYKAFGNQTKEDDELALHLAFYLASWGMYRGSSFLLQKDYRIHIPVIEELLDKEYDLLMGINCSELKNEVNQKKLIELNAFVSEYYEVIRKNVKEKDLSLIQTLDEVEIRLVAMPDKPISGKIYHISEMLDPDTRSVEVLIECDNSTRLMKPEMYGTVKLSDREAEVIRIPTSAILQEEENMYVLVELGNNDYRKQKIETGHTEDGKTVVLSGLNVGDEIVVTGAFYLLDAR